MGILAEIEDKFIDEIDRYLANDKPYQDAIRNLHNFTQNNIPKEKEDECGDMVSKLTSAVQHISFQTGMKIGAKVTAELFKYRKYLANQTVCGVFFHIITISTRISVV